MADAERIAEPLPEVGHVVAVRGSDTLMSVEDVDGNEVQCVWMRDGIVYRNRFPREVLFNRTLSERAQQETHKRMADAMRERIRTENAKPSAARGYLWS